MSAQPNGGKPQKIFIANHFNHVCCPFQQKIHKRLEKLIVVSFDVQIFKILQKELKKLGIETVSKPVKEQPCSDEVTLKLEKSRQELNS